MRWGTAVLIGDVPIRSAGSLWADMGIFPLIGIGNFEHGPIFMSERNLWQNSDMLVLKPVDKMSAVWKLLKLDRFPRG